MTDNSTYTSYCNENGIYSWFKFKNGNTVEINPFIMGQYEVTRTLFKNVMGFDPSFYQGINNSKEWYDSERKGSVSGKINYEKYNLGKDTTMPVENLTLLMVVGFCNKLSILKGYDPVYTCKLGDTELELQYFTEENYKEEKYSNGKLGANEESEKITIIADFTKNGYRLPTPAEFEFAAKGANINAPEWKYAFAGIQSSKKVKLTDDEYKALSDEEKALYDSKNLIRDDNLAEVAWYSQNSKVDFDFTEPEAATGETHIEQTYPHMVGLKKPNSLKLYDMTGNIAEYTFTDKFGFCGGSYDSLLRDTIIGESNSAEYSSKPNKAVGIRLCRTIVKK